MVLLVCIFYLQFAYRFQQIALVVPLYRNNPLIPLATHQRGAIAGQAHFFVDDLNNEDD